MRKSARYGILLCLFGSPAVDAGELYRWMDDQGRLHISDRLPPGQTTYSTLDTHGVRIQDIQLAPPEDPVDSAARERMRQEIARLRQSYVSEADIEALRDQRLADIQSNLDFLKQQRAALIEELGALKTRRAAVVEAGKAVPPILETQIQQTTRALTAHDRAIAERNQDLVATRAAYDADLAAYRKLIGSPPADAARLSTESASPPPRP
ncbi:MAG TPA: DUF4124 domain-containing protein [Candidatus Acidoferrales bacterium]|nr:DUF4124 domain-containing protein [Candidatus Acidoferrales bacterium]